MGSRVLSDYEWSCFLLNLKTNRPATAAIAKTAPTAAKTSVLSAIHRAVIDSGDVMTVEPLGWAEEKLPVHPANLW